MRVKRNPAPQKKTPIIQKLILDNRIRLGPPYELEQEIKARFTFTNPEYIELCKRRRLSLDERPDFHIMTKEKINGRWTSRKIPKFVYYWEYDGPELILPRGAFHVIKGIFNKHRKKYKLVNRRVLMDPLDIRFKGELSDSKGQDHFLGYNAKNGILQAGTGTGKTVMSLYYLSKIQQPTIIVVDTNELLEQWKNRVSEFLGVHEYEIGHIGGGKASIHPITVALVQTLKKHPEYLEEFGMLIVDECHVATTQSYGMVINEFKGQYVMGLSATPRRKDGYTRVMFWLLGKIHLVIDQNKVEKLPAKAIFVISKYNGEISFQKQYAKAQAAMVRDPERNQLIVDNIIKQQNIFGVHLILSRSSQHLEELISMMPEHLQLISDLLIGKISKKDRKKIVELISRNQLKFLFATDRLIGKGFDEELLSVLHLTTPIGDPDFLQQTCGRVTRVPRTEEVKKKKKKAYIFYYFDRDEQILRGAASRSSKRFQELGIEKEIMRLT